MTPALRVFISYRRDDTPGHAGRLYDALVQHFGAPNVFMDVDNIEIGEDFTQAIEAAVASCDVLFAMIGPRWLTVADASGERRLDQPGDYVRIEIEAALGRDVHVVPALVEGAKMPGAAELPDTLAPLARRNAVEMSSGPRWRYDVERLIGFLERVQAAKQLPGAGAALSAPEGLDVPPQAAADFSAKTRAELVDAHATAPMSPRRPALTTAVVVGGSAVAGALALFALGSAVLHRDTKTESRRAAAVIAHRPPKTRVLKAAAATVRVPESATAASAVGDIGGKSVHTPSGGQLVLTTTHATGPRLLPATLATEPATRSAVAIGPAGAPVRAYRYSGLVVGVTPAIAYVVPTSKGVVTALCLGESADARAGCRIVLRTLRITGAQAYGLGDARSVARIHKLLGTLQASIAAHTGALRAGSPGTQSTAARALATAFATASGAIAPAKVSPELRPRAAQLVAALAAVASAMNSLAAASAAQDRSAYARASQAATTAQRAATASAVPF